MYVFFYFVNIILIYKQTVNISDVENSPNYNSKIYFFATGSLEKISLKLNKLLGIDQDHTRRHFYSVRNVV